MNDENGESLSEDIMSVGLGKVTTRDGSGNSTNNLILFSAFRMKHLLDHDDKDGNIFTTYEKKSVAERSPRRVSGNTI